MMGMDPNPYEPPQLPGGYKSAPVRDEVGITPTFVLWCVFMLTPLLTLVFGYGWLPTTIFIGYSLFMGIWTLLRGREEW